MMLEEVLKEEDVEVVDAEVAEVADAEVADAEVEVADAEAINFSYYLFYVEYCLINYTNSEFIYRNNQAYY